MIPNNLPAERPLASVIVRSMDRPTLDQALASVAQQTCPGIEVVVVNARGDHRELPAQCGRFPLRMVGTGTRLGRAEAANLGLANARGQYVLFLDDDDWIEPAHVATLAEALARDPSAVGAYSGVSCILADPAGGTPTELMRYDFPWDPARLLCENYLPIHSVLFSREAAQRTEGFDTRLPIFEDWDFWLQLARVGPLLHVGGLTAIYRLGTGDSGLFGNTELQEQMAARVLAKWQPRWRQDEMAALWRVGRAALREAAERAAQLRQRDELIAQQCAEIGRQSSEVNAKAQELASAYGQVAQALENAARERQQFQRMLDEAQDEHDRLLQAAEREQQRLQGVLQATVDEAAREQLRLQQLAQAAHEQAAREARRLQQAIDDGVRAQQQLQQSLHAAVGEHAHAVELLRKEQYTVLRPVARNVKRALMPWFLRLPRPAQNVVRRLFGRPVHALPPQVPVVEPAREPVPVSHWREVLAGGKPGMATVLVFPVIDWHFRVQRPQHLARELAQQGHRVLYFSTTFAQGAGPADCRLLGSPAPNVHLVQLALEGAHPNIYEDVLPAAQAQALADTVAWLQREADLGSLVSIVNLPFWRPVADVLPANLMVYDCMDYHAGFSTNMGPMLEEEHALLRDCDLLLTSSLRLSQLMREKAPHKPHALVRNGTQVEHFATVPPTLQFKRDKRPVVGYFGAISEWFDIVMVTEAARQRPDWRFVLVGSTFGCDTKEAQKLPNIEFTGEVPYAELPGWVHGFDVCVIPFLLNELTSCTNPVKVYEYLSAGKPVVATRMPELEAIADQVLLADDANDFVRQVDRALSQSRDGQLAQARREWASQHSWACRAQQVSDALDALVPKVSVVVLCYNNLALTQACLASVERHSHWPKLELVVVDNASTDGTAAWLREFAATRPWVKLVLNRKNTGFAAGNNVGLDAASGDILVMLNNDTQVSPGWIHGLWHHLARDPALGMVGPVTNNIGNEAKIEPGYQDTADMPAWAVQRSIRYAGQQTDCRVLAFFCVALRRDVYEEVGGLDEAFGIGFFEDDDYCNRVRAAGWHLAIADDVFVHHHLSASFDQLKASSRQALFEKNRAIYEKKWGPWIPHQYRQPETHE